MKTVIIDVRTRKEFNEGSYPRAVNLPSGEFEVSKYNRLKNHHIALVCFSGKRAERVKTKLELAGFSDLSLLQYQMVHLEESKINKRTSWTVDRQFRLALGMLIGIFLIGNYMFNSAFSLAILLVVFSGLIYSAITDNCYLKMGIAALPWNRKKKYHSTDSIENLVCGT